MEQVIFQNNTYPMGWGEEGDPPAHKLIKERAIKFDLLNLGFFSEPTYNDVPENSMETLCRSKFQFDEGWCFHISEQLLYGEPLVHSQGNIGSCVGAGGGLALAAKASQEILNEGDPEEPYGYSEQAMPFTGFHYGAGRCKNLWDGSKFKGSRSGGDGSYCSAQIWAYKTVGILPCNFVKNSRPFPQSSDVRDWGNNKNNLLNNHLTDAAKFKMDTSINVTDVDSAKNVICNLKQPCHICSNWGFAPRGFDTKYQIMVYKREGSWAHNMTLYGIFAIKGAWFVIVKNSWGPRAHEPIGLGFPLGCFVIPIELFAKWIKQAECASIGELNLKLSHAQ